MRGFAQVFALALAPLFALTVMFGRPAGAATPCAVTDWLADLYLQSRALQESVTDGRADPGRIRAVANTLGRQPRSDLSRLLGQSGLQRDRAEIIRFIDAQNAALTGAGSARDLRDATRRMAKILGTMTCDDNPGARAGTDRYASAAIGSATGRHSRSSARQGQGLASTFIRPTNLGIIAALLTLVGVAVGVLAGVMHSRKLRRIERRYACTAALHAHWQDGHRDGHFVDISRRGCKLRLDHQLRPHTSLTIDAGSLMLTGRVIWSNVHYSGVLFPHRLDDQTLKSFLKQTRSQRHRFTRRSSAPTAPEPP